MKIMNADRCCGPGQCYEYAHRSLNGKNEWGWNRCERHGTDFKPLLFLCTGRYHRPTCGSSGLRSCDSTFLKYYHYFVSFFTVLNAYCLILFDRLGRLIFPSHRKGRN